MRKLIWTCAIAAWAMPALAASGIVYTCDTTVNTLAPQACGFLNATIAPLYSTAFTNANASIYVKLGNTTLGQSEILFDKLSYSQFRSKLVAAATSSNDSAAIAGSVPVSSPFGSAMVEVPTVLERAFGIANTFGLTSSGAICQLTSSGCYDGLITISNTAKLFFRVGTIAQNQYDFYSAVQHETDEILGTASCAFGCGGDVSPADLFRYHSNGTRSNSAGGNSACTSANTSNACFSLDGLHMLQQYNNINNGDDAGDWVTNCQSPLVQDAAICSGTAGVDINSNAEILVLDVVGYTLRQAAGPPSVTSLTPPVSSGASQTLTVTFNAPGGSQSLDVLNVLINNALDGRQACYLAYSVGANTLNIVADSGDASSLTGKVMNGSGTVGNSQCTVTLNGSSASGTGNTFTLTLNLSFSPSFGGNKVVYAAVRDTAQNNSGWMTMGVYGVPPLPSTFPIPGGMTPASGTSAAQTITFTYRDQTSVANLQTVWALVNTAIDGRSACYVAYYRPGNALYLYPDNGDGTQATNIVLAGNNTISNSQCSISAQGSSVQASGNTLSVTLAITFKPAFSGFKAVWMAAQTLAGVTSLWQALGAEVLPGN